MLTAHGDFIELIDLNGRFFLVRLQSGATLQTHRGVFKHDELIGKEYGAKVDSHTNYSFYLIQPSTADLVNHIKRKSQIMFPKDIDNSLSASGGRYGQSYFLRCARGYARSGAQKYRGHGLAPPRGF
jgi:tRNA A58 N-methylase Trm61